MGNLIELRPRATLEARMREELYRRGESDGFSITLSLGAAVRLAEVLRDALLTLSIYEGTITACIASEVLGDLASEMKASGYSAHAEFLELCAEAQFTSGR